jgi:hypothetical protein
MLDQILELFERDKKKRHGRPTGKRSLMDRVSGMLGDDDRRRHDDSYGRQYDDRPRHVDDRDERYARPRDDDDDRPRYADDRHGYRRDDDDEYDHRRHGDDHRRFDDDRYRGSEYRKSAKKKRFADLFEID